MKKIISFLLIITTCICLTGCSKSSEIQTISQNLTTYDMLLEFNNEDKTLTGVNKVDYINTSEDELVNVYFHLYPNAFRENAKASVVSLSNIQKAYPNGKSYGKIEINECKVKDATTNFSIGGEDENILIVELNSKLKPKAKTTIEISYVVTIPNINHRFGYGNNTINLGNFYPIACMYENGNFVTDLYHYNGDPFYSDISNYNVKIKYNKNLTLATSGSITNTTEGGSTKVTSVNAITVRDFAMVLSNKFNIKETEVNNTKILYYYYGDTNPEKSLITASDSIKTFNKLFGNYPYETLSVVEANFVHGGMEYPQLILISDDIELHDDYINVIVHETAHQWWYGMVGNNEYKYGWLDEGLTEYSTALFYEKNTNYNKSKDDIIKNANANYALYIEVYSAVYKEVDTSMNRKLNEYKTEPEYVYIAYVKGMLLFDNIREVIGDKKFFNGLQTYFENGKFKNNTPENLIIAFNDSSKTDLSSLFNSWINGDIVIERVA